MLFSFLCLSRLFETTVSTDDFSLIVGVGGFDQNDLFSFVLSMLSCALSSYIRWKPGTAIL